MKDEFTFLRPAILLAASVLVFAVGGRAFREAGEQRAQIIAAMRAATHSAPAQGTAGASGVCSKVCPEGGQSTNGDRGRVR